MRPLYTSPRQENIDRVVALLAEHGIETTVTGRSNWNRPSYQRFSYAQRNESRESWPQVWVNRADDYTQARTLMRGLGIEPMVRHGEELAAARSATPEMRRSGVATRVRRIVLLALAAAFIVLMLRYMGKI
jgi:broad specificity phosphatase PhoE